MNADLEETLRGLGPEYHAVVDRMVGAFADNGIEAPSRPWVMRWHRPALIAATLLVCLGGALLFTRPGAPSTATSDARSPYVLAYSQDAVSVAAIVRTQNADGSWGNDFITRQNAAALRTASGDASRIAYRRAVRYLRAKGLSPLTDDELRARGSLAAHRMVRS